MFLVNPAASSVTPRTRVVIQKALASDHQVVLAETIRRDHATKIAREAAEAGAKDIKSLGVGQATLATLQEGIDRIPPMGPQLQVSLAGVGNLDSFVGPRMQQLQPPTVMKAVTTTDPEILRGVRGGIETGADLSSPAQTKQFIKRDKVIEQKKLRVSELNEQLTALKELEKDPKNLQIYLNDNPEIKDIYNRKEGDMTRRQPEITRMKELLGRDLITLEEGLLRVINSRQ